MNLKALNKSKFVRKTGIFFHSAKWRNFLVFFGFVVLAFVFWLIHYYQQKFEYELVFPVEYVNVPEGMGVSDSLPDKIHVKVADKGSILISYLWGGTRNPLTIDVGKLADKQQNIVVQRNYLDKAIRGRLYATTQVTDFYPDNITIHCSRLSSRELPVSLDGSILPAAGYVFTDSLQIIPAKVTVYGDTKSLKNVGEIKTELVQKKNIDKKIDFSLSLQIPQGLKSAITHVQVKAEAEAYTEKIFELPIISDNLPENTYVRFFPSSVEVACKVLLSKYSRLSKDDLAVGFNYSELKAEKSATLRLHLIKKPKEVIDCRINPEEVEYIIEQKNNL